MMWFLLLLLHTLAHFGPVSSADQNQGKIFLRSKDNPCEGHVEAYYGNEKGYVGDKHWRDETEQVVCKTTHCGERVSSSDMYRPLKSKVWLNELKCKGTENSLWECDGWPGPDVSFYKKPTVKKITCSYKISFHLKQDKCEGAVQYTIDSPNKNQTGYICSEGFGDVDASLLCKSIGCGVSGKTVKSEWMRDDKFLSSQRMQINCAGIKDVSHLWQCVESLSSQCSLPASVRCQGHKRMQLKGSASNVCSGKLQKEVNGIWTELDTSEVNKTDSDLCMKLHCGGSQNTTSQHLNCKDQVKVVLTDNRNQETKCYGEVKIKKNNDAKHVCGTDWDHGDAEMVCKELKCGNVIKSETQQKTITGIMNHVNCTGIESSLWYCRAEHRKQECSTVPYVVCSDSMEVSLEDGPGKCAGRLKVKHEGEWKLVSDEGWNNDYAKRACNQLGCGDDGKLKSGEFSQGPDLLAFSCKADDRKLSQCTRSIKNNNNRNLKAVELICNENKVLFLEGSESCSGLVGIEHGEEPYWLSGSNQTWNEDLANLVCQQMHCGKALNISQKSSESSKSIWNESFSCSPDKKSIFDCNTTQNHLSDHNETIAHVKCEGKITVRLQHKCWGTVIISIGKHNGAVSGKYWTEELSKQLCDEQKCGKEIVPSLKNPTKSTAIIVKRLYKLKKSTKLRKYSIVKMEDSRGKDPEDQYPAYVVCKGSIKPRFNASRHKCSGNVEVSYEDKWFPVSKQALSDDNTRNTICKELGCDTALYQKDYFGPRPETSHIITIQQCSQNKFDKCEFSGEEKSQTSELGGLHCSAWKTVALEVENVCKGEVVVYSGEESEPKRSFVSSQYWTEAEGKQLCHTMNCGDYKLMKNSTKPPEADFWYDRIFNCSANATNIWDCEGLTQDNTLQKKKLFIECKDEPLIKLETVNRYLSIDGTKVCNSQWKTEYSHRVCQELGYGNAIPDLREKKVTFSPTDSFHVHCNEHNYLIGQCERVKGKCNAGPVSIYCSANVTFSTSERCGGALRVKYGEDREEVCQVTISKELSNNLCESLKCGGFKETRSRPISQSNMETSLNCSSSFKDPTYCVKKETCKSPTTFTCQGYQPPPPPPPPVESTNPVPIIVGVLIVLILVVLIVIFVRYRIKRRNRKSMVPSADMEEADWDSGEYEDVDKSDEMESFNRHRFRSDSEVEGERDVESNRSYNYDDIDEVAEAQPLTPQGSMVHAAKDEDMQDGVDKPSDEGVTYEVEDSQENYDDIDASPENAKTTADVHDGPKPAPEGDAADPKDQVQKDEDYLVPGQDG